MGFFYGFVGSLFNVFNSETDLLAYRFWGEISGAGIGAVEIPVADSNLSLNLFHNAFNKATTEKYPRGLKGSADDVTIKKLKYYDVSLFQLNYRFFSRRIQINAGVNRQREAVYGLNDMYGNEISSSIHGDGERYAMSYGIICDFTDDRADPREGYQIEAFRYDKLDNPEEKSKYYNLDYNFTYFIPFFNQSTWVFNAYRSDAILEKTGDLDASKVKNHINLKCEDQINIEKCQSIQEGLVTDQLTENRHGRASPIGGTQRMQAYPSNRFVASHSQTFGSEFRFNLKEEFTPFNIGILKGIRTGVQFAAFYEKGMVTDIPKEFLNLSNYQPSYGGGLRLILASGFVIRFDLAMGNEGAQKILIFQYPWNVF